MGMNDPGKAERSADAARQGEVVFGKPWKRTVFFASLAAAVVVAAVLLNVFT
jgi:hypothetical protein